MFLTLKLTDAVDKAASEYYLSSSFEGKPRLLLFPAQYD
jgi:hypothetical protein